MEIASASVRVFHISYLLRFPDPPNQCDWWREATGVFWGSGPRSPLRCGDSGCMWTKGDQVFLHKALSAQEPKGSWLNVTLEQRKKKLRMVLVIEGTALIVVCGKPKFFWAKPTGSLAWYREVHQPEKNVELSVLGLALKTPGVLERKLETRSCCCNALFCNCKVVPKLHRFAAKVIVCDLTWQSVCCLFCEPFVDNIDNAEREYLIPKWTMCALSWSLNGYHYSLMSSALICWTEQMVFQIGNCCTKGSVVMTA